MPVMWGARLTGGGPQSQTEKLLYHTAFVIPLSLEQNQIKSAYPVQIVLRALATRSSAEVAKRFETNCTRMKSEAPTDRSIA